MKFTYYLRGAVAMLVLVSTMPSCSQAQPSQTQKLNIITLTMSTMQNRPKSKPQHHSHPSQQSQETCSF